VAKTEDVLEIYKQPYDPLRPVICFDETNRQLIEERHIPATGLGQVKLVDYEYRRCGVANLFMMFEPLAARRYITVTETRTRVDFAHCIKELIDTHYPYAEKIIAVMDNLNTHSIASLYQAFPPAEARRLAEKLEIHYTPKHASWLNMAEIEIGVLVTQCLASYTTHINAMRRNVAAWQCRRNFDCASVNWRFSTADARIKLKKLYPLISYFLLGHGTSLSLPRRALLCPKRQSNQSAFSLHAQCISAYTYITPAYRSAELKR
jgi:hypothetical protein